MVNHRQVIYNGGVWRHLTLSLAIWFADWVLTPRSSKVFDAADPIFLGRPLLRPPITWLHSTLAGGLVSWLRHQTSAACFCLDSFRNDCSLFQFPTCEGMFNCSSSRAEEQTLTVISCTKFSTIHFQANCRLKFTFLLLSFIFLNNFTHF